MLEVDIALLSLAQTVRTVHEFVVTIKVWRSFLHSKLLDTTTHALGVTSHGWVDTGMHLYPVVAISITS